MYFQRIAKPAKRTYYILLKNTISDFSCKVPNRTAKRHEFMLLSGRERMPEKLHAFCLSAIRGKTLPHERTRRDAQCVPTMRRLSYKKHYDI